MKPALVLVYCRAGFERECAQELTTTAGEMGVSGFVNARPESGFALFHAHDEAMGLELGKRLEYRRLVFARQMIRAGPRLEGLEAGERVLPIARALRALGRRFSALWLEMPDTNEGKALSALAKVLRPHLVKALGREGAAVEDEKAHERAHVFFVSGSACHVGVSDARNSAPWPMGIPRLRMPGAAPSRSTLKLAEAFMQFERAPAAGMTAVDLGASPGGWTWQLVQRGAMVTAVDNGPMDPALLET
ncbi:MAG: 23S rRNA (cytidine(2498)-2'-O)-methyltransferase RlmM, partial [Bacillota bacterium]